MKESIAYLTIREAESLVVHRILVFPKKRLTRQRATKKFNVCVPFLEERLLPSTSADVVLPFSGVLSLDIPESSGDFFLNYLKVPRGLLSLKGRVKPDNEIPYEIGDKENVRAYEKLRCGMLGLYKRVFITPKDAPLGSAAKKLISSFGKLSDFKRNFLLELSGHDHFPKRQKSGAFRTDSVARIAWWASKLWGSFVIEEERGLGADDASEQTNRIRSWLGKVSKSDIDSQFKEIMNAAPDELREELDFIMGYLLAARSVERLEDGESHFDPLSIVRHDTGHLEIVSWFWFFQAFYDSELSYLYLVEAHRSNLWEIERLAYGVAFEVKIDSENITLEIPQPDTQELIGQYLNLWGRKTKSPPVILDSTKAKSVFENSLSEDNLSAMGIGGSAEFARIPGVENTCYTNADHFYLKVSENVEKNLKWYVLPDSRENKMLKKLGFKVASPQRILKNKKVLVSFCTGFKLPSIAHLFSYWMKSGVVSGFEKVVLILLVDLPPKDVQSVQFENEISSFEELCMNRFERPVEVLVKSAGSTSDVEITRNLRNALSDFDIGSVEVMEEGFSNQRAAWLLSTDEKYFVMDPVKNYTFIQQR